MTDQELIKAIGAELHKLLVVSQKNILTLEEASVYTGRSQSTLKKLARERKIASYRPDKSPTFLKSELERYMMRNPVKSMEQIESMAATILFNRKRRVS